MKPFTTKQHYRRVVPLLLAGVCFTAPKTSVFAQDNVLLPQGNFEQVEAGDKPAGWQIQSPEKTTLAGDAQNRWVQLRDGAVMMHFLKLSPEWRKLTISARFKLSNYEKGPEGWHGARIGLRFVDEKNQMVGGYPVTPDVTTNTDWVTKEVTIDIPAGATQLQLDPGLWGSKGLLEIDDIVVKASTEATAAQAVPAVDAAWPASAKVIWGSEPVQVQSAMRARVSLNGPWKF